MATPSAILSILVNANTGEATAALSKFDAQLAATNAKARTAVKAQLGGTFDGAAFTKYEAAANSAKLKTQDRKAFRAALGADYSAAGFTAYERALATGEGIADELGGFDRCRRHSGQEGWRVDQRCRSDGVDGDGAGCCSWRDLIEDGR